ncbi:MAG: hypothetical protein RLZZ618_498 [Pseudomonadota bacterium]|jgi:hypothetical protein
MTPAPLLKRFVESELARAPELIQRTAQALQDQLRQPKDGNLSSAERQHHLNLLQTLSRHQADYLRQFTESLRTIVLADLAAGSHDHHRLDAGSGNTSRLQLMDESRVETEIEVSRAIQLIDTTAEWELRELQTLTSTLREQDHVTAESNPLRPQAYAQALWQAAQTLPAPPVQQALLLRLSAGVMAGFLKQAWSAACSRLESQGVTPSIYRTVVFAPGVSTRPPEVDITQPGSLDAIRRSMPHSDGVRPAALAPKAATAPVPDVTDLARALAHVEMALARSAPGQALGSSPSSTPKTGIAAPRLSEHRVALLSTTGDIVDRQIIELLTRLFESILNDPSLHAPIRQLMARLQVPALRIALSDPSMLDDYAHPVWMFIARVVSTGTSYPFPADPRLLDLLTFCDALINHMAGQAQQDAALFRSSLARLDAFLNEQLRQQQAEAQPTIDTLARAEQADVLQQQLSGRLAEQLAPLQVGPALRRMVTGPWARLIAQSMINFGEKDEQTLGHLKVVDELLWSLKLPDHPQSRQRLVALLPGLLQRLRAGMALADVNAAEQQVVLDELMPLHSEALRPGGRTLNNPDELSQSPEEIMRRLREEIDPPPDDGPGFSDSLIDLASMDTVPAELLPEPVAASRHAHAALTLKTGTRYRIFLHSRWTQVQLLWRSDSGRYMLFAGETAHRPHSITQRALERLSEADLVKPLDLHALIQHAVDAVLRKLGEPV